MPMMNWNTTSAEVQVDSGGAGHRPPQHGHQMGFPVGDLVKIRIANLRETLHGMQHPIHFHGQRFLVLEQNGVRNTNLAWKDTFLLPVGQYGRHSAGGIEPGHVDGALPCLGAHGVGHDDDVSQHGERRGIMKITIVAIGDHWSVGALRSRVTVGGDASRRRAARGRLAAAVRTLHHARTRR